MTSLERLKTTLDHEQPERVCVDFGPMDVSCVSSNILSELRKSISEDEEFQLGIIKPYQMLGEIDENFSVPLALM